MTNQNQSMLRIDNLLTVDPQTDNQGLAFQAWKKDESNLILNGSAGTGKTFIALYLALEYVLDKSNTCEKIILIRSIVPTRNSGFLPGTIEEKMEPYKMPYRTICKQLFDHTTAFDVLENMGVISFESTDFIRGLTFDDSVVIVDEMQNCNFHELDSIITRVGLNTRVIIAGDYYQSDFTNGKDRDGIVKFLTILNLMQSFNTTEFTSADIVRSDFVRDYIITKEALEREPK